MTIISAAVMAAFALALAAPAGADGVPGASIAGTPALYVVSGTVGASRPRAYVVFATRQHLHEPRTVVAKLDGHAGRTFAERRGGSRTCYRSALLLSPPSGDAAQPIRAGSRYRVAFVQRASAHASTDHPPFASFRLRAQSLRAGAVPPPCR